MNDETTLSWSAVRAAVDAEQEQLAALLANLASGKIPSALDEVERFDRVLGITCHAVYHAGQIQLIKRLAAA